MEEQKIQELKDILWAIVEAIEDGTIELPHLKEWIKEL